MKKTRILTAFVTFVMLGSSMITATGCGSTDSDKAKKNKIVEVSADQEWFDSTRVVFGTEYADLGLDYYYIDEMSTFYTDSGIYTYVNGNYPIDYMNMDEEAYMDALLNDIVCYDYDGSVKWKTDVNSLNYVSNQNSDVADDEDSDEELLPEEETELTDNASDTTEIDDEVEIPEGAELPEETETTEDESEDIIEDDEAIDSTEDYGSQYVSGLVMGDDNDLYVKVSKYSYAGSSDCYYAIDSETGKVSDTQLLDEDLNCTTPVKSDEISEEDWIDLTKKIGDYKISSLSSWSMSTETSITKLAIEDANGNVKIFNLSEAFPETEIYGVTNMTELSSDEVLVGISTSDYYLSQVIVNLNTLVAEKYEASDELIKFQNYSYYLTEIDGKTYCTSTDGVYQIDYLNSTAEKIFDYNSCYSNMSELSTLKVQHVNENGLIVAGSDYDMITGANSIVAYKLTKSDSNPNAGKTLLTAASLAYLNDISAEAIYQFNSNSDKYFIQYDSKYSEENITVKYDDSDAYTQAALDFSNQLAVDLMNGEGPDIILGSYSYRELSNPNYLVDLSDYASKLNSEDYYANIIESCKIDGKLYQMPLSFVTSCISGPDGMCKNGMGITYEEYPSIVDEYCNGTDPITFEYNRLDVFSMLLDNMDTPLVNGEGKINLNNEEFKAVCEFCSQLPEKSLVQQMNGTETEGIFQEIQNAEISFLYVGSVYDFMLDNANKDIKLYGMPSLEGNGPIAFINDSVAISVSCSDVDGAMAFIDTIMSDEVMDCEWSFPISRKAVKEQTQTSVDSFNKGVDRNKTMFSEAEAAMYEIPFDYADEDAANKLLECLDNIGKTASSDTAIFKIINEEIQPYFVGDKSLDDVISIMENKCQTVLNERG
ncbi:MAG: extracellular solute-binding protein [Clostridia bacterium]|nr:extracellular solute-binding protein [Clostridia bacterium]